MLKIIIKIFVLATFIFIGTAWGDSSHPQRSPINVGILVYDGVETLDYAGPLETFNLANDANDADAFKYKTPRMKFNVFLIAKKKIITTAHYVKIHSHYLLNNHPHLNVLVIPGGPGVDALVQDKQLLNWVKREASRVKYLSSVCSGAIVLGYAGLLKNLKATTHHARLNQLQKIEPQAHLLRHIKYVDNGKIILSAGISSGIDMSLHIIAKIYGKEVAALTANDMEYSNYGFKES